MDDAGGMRRHQRIGDLDGVLQGLVQTQPLAGSGSSSVLPSTYSMAMKSTPSAESMSWTVTMFGWFRAEADRASWTKRWRRPVGDLLRGQHLEGDVALQTGVAGAVDLAHAAGSEETGDLIRPKPGPWASGTARLRIGNGPHGEYRPAD